MSTRRLLERMARSSDPVLAAEAQKDLDRLDADKRAKRARVRARPGVREEAEKKRATRAEKRKETEALRLAAWARADAAMRIGEWGACEFCRQRTADELHHLISGGLRRTRQSLGNVAALCIWCHRAWHASDLDCLLNARIWATKYGYYETRDAVDRRIAKVEEARRTPTVPVRAETR